MPTPTRPLRRIEASPLLFQHPALSLSRLTNASQAVWKDRYTGLGMKLIVLITFLVAAAVFLTVRVVPPEIPLYFSKPWGAAQLAGREMLWGIPMIGIALAVVHLVISSLVHERHPLASRVVVWMGVCLLSLLMLSVITIYIRVGPRTFL